ncbi:MAG: hypothetical protein ACFFC7_12570 [Candidatus Hermodarchaeota archaeon]
MTPENLKKFCLLAEVTKENDLNVAQISLAWLLDDHMYLKDSPTPHGMGISA